MKKLIAVLLCMVLCVTMIPSFFASASPLPAEAEAVVGEGEVIAQNDDDPSGPEEWLEFLIGLWKTFLGPLVTEQFWPALKEVLKLVSPGEFFKTIGKIIKDVLS